VVALGFRTPGACGIVHWLSSLTFSLSLSRCLSHTHTHTHTHRDVKLDNLLLDSQRNIRVVDFGFSVSFQKGQKLRKARPILKVHYIVTLSSTLY
jgi:serine/threonine protein kinase